MPSWADVGVRLENLQVAPRSTHQLGSPDLALGSSVFDRPAANSHDHFVAGLGRVRSSPLVLKSNDVGE